MKKSTLCCDNCGAEVLVVNAHTDETIEGIPFITFNGNQLVYEVGRDNSFVYKRIDETHEIVACGKKCFLELMDKAVEELKKQMFDKKINNNPEKEQDWEGEPEKMAGLKALQEKLDSMKPMSGIPQIIK